MKRFIPFVAILAAPLLAGLTGCSLAGDHDHESAYYNAYPQYYGYAPRQDHYYDRDQVYYVEPRHDDHIVVRGY